ncbi:MAG: hypothetical protein QXO75_00655 [Nitrososphaerota archaeon]
MSSVNINISLQEIYRLLCPKCKRKVNELIRQKLPDELIEQLLEQSLGEAAER